MDILVISSLDALCRQQACEAAAAAHPGSVVVVQDLLDEGLVIRRTVDAAGRRDRTETILEHSCLSCAVRLDLVPAVEELLAANARPIIIGLPPALPAATAIAALNRGLGRPALVGSVILACAPDAMEDHLWDAHTLFESGFTPAPGDERTPGEFMVGELDFADTILSAQPDIMPAHPAGQERGLHLVQALAPHAHIAAAGADLRRGRFHYGASAARCEPGTAPAQAGRARPGAASPFTTVVHRLDRELHPGRFRLALGTLAAGCCVLRGQFNVASAPGCRITLQGIGPRVWLENAGTWPSDSPGAAAGVPATAPDSFIAATGEDLDPAEISRLLKDCELTDRELAAGHRLPDPFGLTPAT